MQHRTRSGLRPVGSKRSRTYGVGSSALAARESRSGDGITDELLQGMSDEWLDRFSAALAQRGLEFGEVSESGPTEHEPTCWLIYPIGKPEEVL